MLSVGFSSNKQRSFLPVCMWIVCVIGLWEGERIGEWRGWLIPLLTQLLSPLAAGGRLLHTPLPWRGELECEAQT
jgi:hypothetical protein